MEEPKKQCEWCEKEVGDSNFGAYSNGFVVMKRMTQPYYFDSKDCLLNWIKGLVKGDEVK